MNDRDVTFLFTEAEAVAVEARQWHRYRTPDTRSKCCLTIDMYPAGLHRVRPVPAGRTGRVRFTISFE